MQPTRNPGPRVPGADAVLSPEYPIAALATPWGESALAVVRVSGVKCLGLLDGMLRGARSVDRMTGHTVSRVMFVDPANGEEVDEVVVAVYRHPRSYTGQDSAEISCHGSPTIVVRILDVLFRNGFRQAEPGEFTLRAFLNGKLDLTRSEAVNEIIRSKTDEARALALHRLLGSVSSRIDSIKDALISLLASIEVRIDYADDYQYGLEEGTAADRNRLDFEEEERCRWDLEKVERDLAMLLSGYRVGRTFQEGATVVIAGRTNAGKSTLFNLLLREERAIVAKTPGTTRDYLDSLLSVDGVPVRLYDTAGLRETDGQVESEGIQRTVHLMANADLVLYVVDAVVGTTAEEDAYLSNLERERPVLRIWNKTDISGNKAPEGFLPMSAATGVSLDRLVEQIRERAVDCATTQSDGAVIASPRQKYLLEKSLNCVHNVIWGIRENQPLDIIALECREAVDSLGEITGEVCTDDILNRIFSEFCVGK